MLEKTKDKIGLGLGFLGIIVLTVYMINVVNSYPNSDDLQSDSFASCLTNKGVVMFGLDTCPHCQRQKELFGAEFELVNYVECSKNPSACQGINSVPTWKINNKYYTGVQSLEQLSMLSACKLDE